jgi:hypothetical protein
MELDGDIPVPLHGAHNESAHDVVLPLLHSLVVALSCTPGDDDALELCPESEEVLLDTEADGYRYLLLRMRTAAPSRAHLSPREQEIARMVAAGYPSKAIASVLNAKLGVNTRAAMVSRLNELHIGPFARGAPSAPATAAAAPLERRA